MIEVQHVLTFKPRYISLHRRKGRITLLFQVLKYRIAHNRSLLLNRPNRQVRGRSDENKHQHNRHQAQLLTVINI